MSSYFWTDVFPAYLGAAGGILAGGVATVALVRDIGTRGGLRAVADASNSRDSAGAPSRNAAVIASTGDVEFLNFARTSMFRNVSGRDVTVLEVRSLTEGVDFRVEGSLPMVLGDHQGLAIRLSRSIGAPAVGEVLVRWTDVDGSEYSSKFLA